MMDQVAPQQPKRRGSAGRIAAVVLAVGFGLFVGRYVVPVNAPVGGPLLVAVTDEGQRQLVFPTFWEAWDALHQNYIGDLDDKDLFYGAVAGMVRATGDPYTVFSDPADSEQFQETLSGQFSGVGIEIGARDGLIRVIAPLAGSPAEQAGILAGDIIVSIDDEPITSDMTVDDVVQHIRGEQGTEVKLTIARQDGEEVVTKEFTLRRDTITIESVRSENLADNIALIELLTFNGDTEDQFAAIASKLAQQKPAGIILDVRNNPGGFLQTAVDIASHFLNPGTLVVSERGDTETEHLTKGNPNLRDIPLVILANQGSASASEIIAGALHEQKEAPVVGEKTFGKGSVQELIPLSDGSSVRVTVAKWFTPKGVSIDDKGIEPTVGVEDNRDTEEDEQLQKAVEEVKKITQ
ncbi:MAG: S41 family peptidase [Candidatus Andersenbacteria bacterium]|nr:S41 family peptidase [Candidatus Andersenbacteria bacterium]MBI3250430.1 S41 family peptidase [Candidatus Andersenbacteria bacterium]